MKINSTKLPAAGGLAQNRLTLEPLRTDGLDALDSEGIEGISQITLVEIEVAWENEFQEVIVRKAADIFGCAAAEGGLYDPIPKSGCLVQAVFLIQFAESAERQMVQLRPPGTLEIGPYPNAGLVERWLLTRGFALAH